MYSKIRLLILLIFPLLSSCFSTKKTQSSGTIPIVDPVITSLDTLTLTEDGTHVYTDTIRKIQHADTCKVDSIVAQISIDSIAKEEENKKTDALDHLNDTVCIAGTGDIMPGTNYPDHRYLPPGNDCNLLFRDVSDILGSADITFGNLEGVFCSEGGKPKECKDPSVCYVFRIPDSYLQCILDAGYDVLSVANNHVNDFGPEGRMKTAKKLAEADIAFAGFLSHPTSIFEHNGIRYGFAAFAPHKGTVDLKDYKGAARIVAGLDSVCDIVLVSFHGGAEGRDYQHVPCTDEEYLGYNRGNVCKFAHTVVDAGADLVFGHGPHVTRAMELYQDRLICYSLGNFCTYARFNLSGPNGIAPIVKVFTNGEGQFLGGQVISVYQSGEGGPRPDPLNRAVLKLRELSETDFPESRLAIDENGKLSRKED